MPHWGIRIDTDGQVMEWTHKSGASSSWGSAEANLSHSTITNVFTRDNPGTVFAEGGEAVEITDEQRELFAK